ncbi:hypothetical protein B0H11DRAFT_1661203, partial [Mycena galericulata]
DIVFIVEFFRFWDPAAIFLLSQLNFRLLGIVRYYESVVWNVPKFLSQWFHGQDASLKLLEDAPALLCGPAVLNFFDRNLSDAGRLDICVGYEGLSDVATFLAAEGYSYRPGPTPRIRDWDLVALVEAAHFPEERLKVYGERSVTQEEHGSRTFRFLRFDRRSALRLIVVHLVRCELHRFVFSMHSTSLMGFISSTHAVSVFARSTFLKRKSFVACQERTPDVDESIRMEGVWLRTYSSPHGRLNVVGAVLGFDRDAEVGSRFIGDAQCWTIPCRFTGDFLRTGPVLSGSAFDVLDWRSGVTRHGSYLRIGEPVV